MNVIKPKAALTLWLLVFLVAAFSVAAVVPGRRHQDPKVVKKVNQHWRVVPNVNVVDLQRQLQILNEEGVSVNPGVDIHWNGDKATIMICDPEEE